jgi:RNA polymerase sigma-70 factor (ECF subfamily)
MKYFDTGKKFFSWIYRITLNESLNQNKRSGFTDILNDETEGMTDSTVSDMEQNELTNNVNAAVNRLDEKYRTLIVLKHYQDLSYDEISDILNIPVGKVKSRLYIAREYLRKSLEGIY